MLPGARPRQTDISTVMTASTPVGSLGGFLGLSAAQILSLSVLAALVATLGSLIATWLKDFVFVRSFERWKERRALLTVYHRYRDPLRLAAEELQRRIAEVCEAYPPAWLRSTVLQTNPKKLDANRQTDPYYERYRFTSTVFRLCAFFGWLELYRQEVTFLNTGYAATTARLKECIDDIRDDLADGTLVKQANADGSDRKSVPSKQHWTQWSDLLIFKEEQRAIGESMLVGESPRTVMGYKSFRSLFDNADTMDDLWWIRVAKGFFQDPQPSADFRRNRLQRMRDHLDEAITLLKD